MPIASSHPLRSELGGNGEETAEEEEEEDVGCDRTTVSLGWTLRRLLLV